MQKNPRIQIPLFYTTKNKLTRLQNERGNKMVEKHLKLLGMVVKDKASDYKGVVVSVSFDLFGCIQADVRSKELDKEGMLKNGMWLDLNRLKVVSKKPVMPVPEYHYLSKEKVRKEHVANGYQGCANKSMTVSTVRKQSQTHRM